ncbi:hypothetical protein EXT46_10995 [Pseudoalteromonas sp. CO325X]|uniref:hypothetical protein n=1 Tax=Pseudoalteromonas sp. CO325X TaxID=1777262 RepID=UPI0010238A6C|nr:hypothetical protein [Pseudoalteromonas sp. CO325X]RZF80540.1 hypothetical protein EXT46_10995 [Pseudoalteromonas sp. CO325X]
MSVAKDILVRTIDNSPEIIEGLKDGTFELFGGVIRIAKGQAGAGQIVKHLVYPGSPEALEKSITNLQSVLQQQSGQIQDSISNLQSSMDVLQGLQYANIALSGLNLAVSSVGFVVVCNKLNHISRVLEQHTTKLDILCEGVLRTEQRDAFKDTARFTSLLKRLSQLSVEDDAQLIKGMVWEIMNQYQYTKLMLTEACKVQKKEHILSALGGIELLQSRLQYLGFAMAYAYNAADESAHAVEAIMELDKEMMCFGRTIVNLVSSEPLIKCVSTEQFEKLKEIVSLRKEIEPAIEYQKNVFNLISARPELKSIVAQNCDEILLIAA